MTGSPRKMARPAEGASGEEGRRCVAAGVYGRLPLEGEVGGRRRRYGRRRLCVLGAAAGKGSVHMLLLHCWRRRDRRRTCRARRDAGVLPFVLIWPVAARHVGGDGIGRRKAVTGLPPELEGPVEARLAGRGAGVLPPACTAGGGVGARWVAAGVGMAGGGSACSERRRAMEASTCYFSAAGVGKTGGRRFGRGGAQACCHRRLRPAVAMGGGGFP